MSVAQRTWSLYATPEGERSPHLGYVAFQDQVLREPRLLQHYLAQHREVRRCAPAQNDDTRVVGARHSDERSEEESH